MGSVGQALGGRWGPHASCRELLLECLAPAQRMNSQHIVRLLSKDIILLHWCTAARRQLKLSRNRASFFSPSCYNGSLRILKTTEQGEICGGR